MPALSGEGPHTIGFPFLFFFMLLLNLGCCRAYNACIINICSPNQT